MCTLQVSMKTELIKDLAQIWGRGMQLEKAVFYVCTLSIRSGLQAKKNYSGSFKLKSKDRKLGVYKNY